MTKPNYTKVSDEYDLQWKNGRRPQKFKMEYISNHLFNIHEKSAESYDKNIEHRELSNKMNTYRRVLLSYAEGKVLEVGVGTGRCLKFYDPK